tara:strand:+ start:2889 stop:3623 length:735 start_codon:yes stop_codon:yes gene_type:complete
VELKNKYSNYYFIIILIYNKIIMSKIKNNLPIVKGMIVDILSQLFSKNILERINNNFKRYYINHVNINILYIISIAYVIYCFFMKDIIFICIFIFLFFFIFLFKKSNAIIYIFPLIVCNIIYEIFLKNNKHFKRLTKHVYIEGYKSSRAMKWRGWDKNTREEGVSKEELERDMENADEKEPDEDDPLEGGEELDVDGDGDKLLEEEDNNAEGADENSEAENIKKVNEAAARGNKVSTLMSKRLK